MRACEDVYDRLFFTWLFGFAVMFSLSLIMMMGSPTQNEYEIVRDFMAGVCAVWVIFFVGLLALVRGLIELVYALNAVERYVGALVSRYKWKRKNSEVAAGFRLAMPDTFGIEPSPKTHRLRKEVHSDGGVSWVREDLMELTETEKRR